MADNNSLKKEYAKLQTRAFSVMIEIIFIFGIPAALAVFLGKKLSDEKTLTYVFLAIAFVLSWVILIARVRKMGAELKKMREQVKEAEKEEHNNEIAH